MITGGRRRAYNVPFGPHLERLYPLRGHCEHNLAHSVILLCSAAAHSRRLAAAASSLSCRNSSNGGLGRGWHGAYVAGGSGAGSVLGVTTVLSFRFLSLKDLPILMPVCTTAFAILPKYGTHDARAEAGGGTAGRLDGAVRSCSESMISPRLEAEASGSRPS